MLSSLATLGFWDLPLLNNIKTLILVGGLIVGGLIVWWILSQIVARFTHE